MQLTQNLAAARPGGSVGDSDPSDDLVGSSNLGEVIRSGIFLHVAPSSEE